MPGVTKHIFDHEIRDIVSMLDNQIHSIKFLLPQEYTKENIINLLKEYYPHEWRAIEFKFSYYEIKDKHIKRHRGRTRFNMPDPSSLLQKVKSYRVLLSDEFRTLHFSVYSEQRRNEFQTRLQTERNPKIERINKKIDKALTRTQQVTPEFIDQLIGLYARKNTSQKDKVYILLELKKYYCPKVIKFFFKLNDTELNRQLRTEAFQHLQSFNYNPRLRKQRYMHAHTNNKKRKLYLTKVYPNEIYSIPKNPDELEYRIENAKEQKLKIYDYFISHSSKDSKDIQKLITAENKLGKNVFCDWINDVDYLKRHLLCEATLKVIERRLNQSKSMIFVESENSLCSIWCKYELNYFSKLNRPIFTLSTKSIQNGKFNLETVSKKWFLDDNIHNLVLTANQQIATE